MGNCQPLMNAKPGQISYLVPMRPNLWKVFVESVRSSANASILSLEKIEDIISDLSLDTAKAREILTDYFRILDEKGEGQVNYQTYLISISTLLDGSFHNRLDRCMQLEDREGLGHVSASQFHYVLSTMNQVLVTFNDLFLPAPAISDIVDSIMCSIQTDNFNYKINLSLVTDHPVLIRLSMDLTLSSLH